MSPTLNLLPDTPTTPASDQPSLSGRASPANHRRKEVVVGLGLVVLWAVSSLLLELGWVGVVLLAVLLLATFHTLVRRRPLRVLLLRDTATFAHGWAGKLLVAAVLAAIPATMVLTSVGGGRFGRYADDSWKALLMLVVLTVSYAASRRLVLTVLIGAVTVAVVSWALSPTLAVARNGDPAVLAHIDQQARRRLAGQQSRRRRRRDRPGGAPARAAGRDRR